MNKAKYWSILFAVSALGCGTEAARPGDAGSDTIADTNTGDGSTECATGFQRCGQVCVPANTVSACGTSCEVCPNDARGTALCVAGQCSLTCNQGTELCATPTAQSCVDTNTDRNHCGSCGNVCPSDQLCVDRACVEPPLCDVNNPASCTGLTYCNPTTNRCAPGCDPRLSDQCGSNETCTNNQCVCSNGTHDCSGVCLSNSSVNSCGTSCTPCALVTNATQMGCNGTSCVVETCVSGYQVSSNGQSCEDINECLTSNGGCHANATCSNTPGSRTCACNAGFSGDGLNCMPLVLEGWQVDAFLKGSNPRTSAYFGYSVAFSGDGSTLAVGVYGESSSTTGINPVPNDQSFHSGAVYVFVQVNGSWAQQAFIKASTTESYDWFGTSVALSFDGNTLAVGATGYGVTGAAYVFGRSDATWSQQALIDTGAGYFGASVALSSDGNTLAVGAVFQGNSGGVYVFTRTDATWTQRALLKASNIGSGDEFGTSVALSSDGNTLAVGARYEGSSTTGINGTPNESANDSGAVYLFTHVNGTWSQQAFIKASNTGTEDRFGTSVALSSDGNTLAVGASYEDSSTTGINGTPDDSATNSGAVYVFTRVSGNWSQQAFIKASNTGIGDRFGTAVALSGDGSTLAVGASFEDSSTTGTNGAPNELAGDSGAVYVFTRTDFTWAQQVFIKASNAGSNDEFGGSVALSSFGDTLAVGATHEASSTAGINGMPNEWASISGAVYTYRRL